MTDLTAEDRAALLAASMACDDAWKAMFRAYEKIREVEVRFGKNARDHDGNYLTDRLSHARITIFKLRDLIHMAALGKEGVRWE